MTHRSMEQNREPRCIYGQLIYGKEDKNTQWRKDSLFSKYRYETWTAIFKRMKLDHLPTPYTKINSKWIKYLNIRPKTIKLLDENTGSKLLDVCLRDDFLDSTPKSNETKVKRAGGTTSN